MARRKTKAEQIAAMSPESFGRLKGEEGKKTLQKYLKTLRTGYTRRVGAFRRKNIVSYAQIAFDQQSPKNLKKVPLTELSRNQLLFEIARYSRFFNSATSTEKGAKRINDEQDKRIFGVDSRGRPRQRMTWDERVRYWELYEEFKNQFPEWSTQPFSETVQQVIADASFTSNGFSGLTLMDKLGIIKDKMIDRYRENLAEDGPNVYSGKWVDFKG